MQATQASVSAPVEVSWSPPSGGAATITGYRIFYGNGENMFVNANNTLSITIPGQVGEMISVRSESAHAQLPSELITVTVKRELFITQSVLNNQSSSYLSF